MPCAVTHRLINFTATAVFLGAYERKPDEPTLPHPVLGAPLSACLATLPDILEPALRNPNHRQFFHSVLFAALVGWGVYKTYQWRPETPIEEIIRIALLIAGSAYLLHLVADSFTRRSLPLIGK